MTEKHIEQFYRDIEDCLKKYDGKLSEEFALYTKSEEPREVYLWLDKYLNSTNIPIELNNLMTDFFLAYIKNNT